MEQRDDIESQYALQLAFQTMKERCQQLQARLIVVEDENICLRHQYKICNSISVLKLNQEDQNIIQNQEEKIDKLKRQKSQLAHHIFMVASENRQLWKKLTKLIKTNKSTSNQSTKKSEMLKQHPLLEKSTFLTYSFKEIPGSLRDGINDKCNLSNNEEKHSMEEISLELINSIMIEKSEIENQYLQKTEYQENTETNLKNVGFTYPEDINTDSLEQLKYHDIKLTQLKEELVVQQDKLKNVLHNLKKKKKNETCYNCKNSSEKLMCQAETQFDSHCSVEHGTTQTSLPLLNIIPDKMTQTSENENICPLCGIVYKKSVSFELFHEHVINHFIA